MTSAVSSTKDLSTMPWWAWILVALVLGGQGTWLFLDARRRGARPWFWGLLGLIQAPWPSVFYWWFVIRPAIE